jgi:tetratricopeptide (TPR) repeat protein
MKLFSYTKYSFSISLLCLLAFAGCKKFLDETPDKSLVVPSSFKDLQALLDMDLEMNIYQANVGDASSDDYYLTKEAYDNLFTDGGRNSYIWGDELFYTQPQSEWSQIYKTVFNANTVLEFVDDVEPAGSEQTRNKLKAAALFFRAHSFFKGLTTFAKAYDQQTAESDPGIPLRLTTDFNTPSTRASIRTCYEQIISDLEQAISLFPEVEEHVMRPGKAAACGLLARVYLNMGEYGKSLVAADECLAINDQLIDFNALDSTLPYPIPQFNKEVLFAMSGNWETLYDFVVRMDTTLYDSYEAGDLRKTMFFFPNDDGSMKFRGTYDASFDYFLGIATDEIYLIKSETEVRTGKIDKGLNTLNKLLASRYVTGTYVAKSGLDAEMALATVLAERRKELIFRDLRWQDLKRLNLDVRFQKPIKRVLDGVTYELPPNDPRYALPLPREVIRQSGMMQNPR